MEVYHDDYDYSIDIYSLGIICFSISSTIHIKNNSPLKNEINGKASIFDDFRYISSNLLVILRAMLDKNPSKRPRITEILYIMEHNMMSIFDSDFEIVNNKSIQKKESQKAIRNDFINEKYKAIH